MDKSETIGDLIAQYNKLAPGARVVCYCASIEHSQHTADMFQLAGIPALHIDGETKDLVRKAAINDFKLGKIKRLCNVDLISERVDVPAMEAVILARPTQSLTLHIQQAMRAMRIDKNNPDKVATILMLEVNVESFSLFREIAVDNFVGGGGASYGYKKATLPFVESLLRANLPELCDVCEVATKNREAMV